MTAQEIDVTPKVTATVSIPSVSGTVAPKEIYVSAVTKAVKIDWESVPKYDGETNITPTTEQQILATSGKAVLRDIIIDPIPSNYGLITWNGSTLTVS